MDGLETRLVPTSIWRKPGCGPLSRGCPWCGRQTRGISAVIDPYGRIISSLPLSEEGVLDTSLPQSLPPTFFADYGELILGLMLLLLLGLGFVL